MYPLLSVACVWRSLETMGMRELKTFVLILIFKIRM